MIVIIQTTGMIAKIDNLRIQETKKNVDDDYSNIINLSKEIKTQKFIKPITIPSPIPKITNANATVYWADEPER